MKCSECLGNGSCCYNIMLPYYVTHGGETPLTQPETKMVNVDKCLLPEVLRLWEKGLKTTGNCCGHGKLPAFISVKEDFVQAMLEMGYVNVPNKYFPNDKTMFKPKTKLVYGDVNKGFNWPAEAAMVNVAKNVEKEEFEAKTDSSITPIITVKLQDAMPKMNPETFACSMTHNAIVTQAKTLGGIIVEKIKDMLDGCGFTDVYILNEDFIIQAITEKSERMQNPPLEPWQLYMLVGSPVWLEDTPSCWAIVYIDEALDGEKKEPFLSWIEDGKPHATSARTFMASGGTIYKHWRDRQE